MTVLIDMPPAIVHTQLLTGVDQDIARCGELHKQVNALLQSLKEKKDFAFRA